RDGEPDARSAVAARARRVDAVEALEQEGQVLGRDPWTGIDDTYLAPAACDSRRDDDLAAGRREAHRVVEQIEHDLVHALAVGPDRRHLRRELRANRDEVIAPCDLDLRDHGREERLEMDVLAIH